MPPCSSASGPEARCDGQGAAPGRGAAAFDTSVPARQAAESRPAAGAVPATLFQPCSSLIYLANFKSADGFTLENLISGGIDPRCAADLEKLQSRVHCITINNARLLPLAGELSREPQTCLPSRTVFVLYLNKFLSHFQLLPLFFPGFNFPWIHISSVRILLFLFLQEEKKGRRDQTKAFFLL